MTRRSRLTRALLITGLVAGSAAVYGAASPAAAAPADCDSRFNNTLPKVLECITVEGVREHQAALQAIADANGGTRSSGTPGYQASRDYAADVLRRAGYQVTVRKFQFLYSVDSSEVVGVPGGATYQVLSNEFNPRTSGTAEGVLDPVDVVIPPGAAANTSTSGCEAADFAGFVVGSVALIQRGTCPFATKALNAQAAGASAVILFNEGQPGRTGFIVPIGDAPGLTIPVVATDFATGEALFGVEGSTVSVTADLVEEERTSWNVLAESNQGDDNTVVMAGAHLDSVVEGPGINDNGSGTAAILEVAQVMRKSQPKNTLRFALWGAEEFGLLGSEYYVSQLSQSQQDRIALYLNFDMVGSPNFFRGIYDGSGDAFPNDAEAPPGSAAIETVFEEFFAERRLASEPTEFSGRSDYGPFIEVGIPSGGLFTGAEGVKTPAQVALYGGTAGVAYDPCYHQACDTFGNVSLEVLDQMADAVGYATFKFSRNVNSVRNQQDAAGAARSAAAASVERHNHNIEGERIDS